MGSPEYPELTHSTFLGYFKVYGIKEVPKCTMEIEGTEANKYVLNEIQVYDLSYTEQGFIFFIRNLY